MAFNNPFLLFFKEHDNWRLDDAATNFDRAIDDFFKLKKDDVLFFKEKIPDAALLPKRPTPNIVMVGKNNFGKKGPLPKDLEFFGYRSWQPSFKFAPTQSKFHILKFDQAVYYPGLLDDANIAPAYRSSMAMFFETMRVITPSIIVHFRQDASNPLFVYFDCIDSFLGYLCYQDELLDFSNSAVEYLRMKTNEALRKVGNERPGSIERKEFGWILNCASSDVYSLLIGEIVGHKSEQQQPIN